MNRSFKKRICFLIIGLLMTSSAVLPVTASDGRRFVQSSAVVDSYTYSKINGSTKVITSPEPYVPTYTVDSNSLGTELRNPSHMTVWGNSIYIVNTGKNNLIVTDYKFGVTEIIDHFENAGKTDSFSSPQGCFLTKEGTLFVADTGNKRIVVLDQDRKLLNIIQEPKSDVFAVDFEFKPQKVAVDSSGRVFVVADGVYEGIMQFYENGDFVGFIGSIPVTASPLEILWKKLLSKEQNSKRAQFVPVSYTNIFLDNEGFLYAVSLSSTLSKPIRRLNPGGGDVLIRNSLAGTSVSGDQIGKTSQFTAICADENGIYYAADSTNSRLFIYDEDGNLLTVFGGKDTGQIGTYKHISSLLLLGKDLAVVDSQSSRITVLYPTDYMISVRDGLSTYRTGRYEESYACWQTALTHNSNFDLAYSKIGMIDIRNQDYAAAMESFRLANDQKNYSKAYVKYRSIWYTKNLPYIITGLLIVIVLVVILVRFRKKRRGQGNEA